MEKRRRLVVAGAGAGALIVIAIAVALLAQKRPDACVPAMRIEVDALLKGGLALKSARSANDVVTRALTSADAADARFFLLRRYDGALCAEARKAVDAAQIAASAAASTKAKAAAIAVTAAHNLAEAQAQIASATAWLAAGIAGDAVVVALREKRAAVDEVGREIERAKGALDVTGYEATTAELEQASEHAAARIGDAKGLVDAAKAAGLKRCVPRVHGRVVDVDGVRAFEGWLLLTGPAHVLLYGIDRETKRCTLLHDVAKKGALVIPGQDVDETLFEWTLPGALVSTTLLVGWTPSTAWFLSKDGDYRSFRHLAHAKCKIDGAASGCPAPPVTGKALEVRCRCVDAHEERSVGVRYAWDGHTVNFEE